MRLKVLFSDEDFDRGEVVDAALGTLPDGRIMVRADGPSGGEHRFYYKSIDGFIEDWADPYEEPKEHWTIGHDGAIFKLSEWENQKDHEEIGNYFDSEKEAELAVRKLKAWKRLKDNGFKIKGWKFTPDMKQIQGNYVKIEAEIPQILINEKDIDLLFGGEE